MQFHLFDVLHTLVVVFALITTVYHLGKLTTFDLLIYNEYYCHINQIFYTGKILANLH